MQDRGRSPEIVEDEPDVGGDVLRDAGTITLFWAAITITAWLFSLAISRTTVRWPSSATNTTVQTSGTSFTGAENVCSTAIWSMMLPLAMATSRGPQT